MLPRHEKMATIAHTHVPHGVRVLGYILRGNFTGPQPGQYASIGIKLADVARQLRQYSIVGGGPSQYRNILETNVDVQYNCVQISSSAALFRRFSPPNRFLPVSASPQRHQSSFRQLRLLQPARLAYCLNAFRDCLFHNSARIRHTPKATDLIFCVSGLLNTP